VSDSASPQRWGEEHMIDLGAVGGPAATAAPDPGPAPSPARRFPRIHNAALAYAAIVIALAAAVVTVVKWSPLHRPIAEAAVADFLEAVHEGDVEAALALTDQADAEGEFLVPEALDSRWEIRRLAQVAYEDLGDGKASAQVYAEIGVGDESVVGHRYHVMIDRGDAQIVDAMPESEAWGSLEYLDLNGVRQQIDLTGAPTYILLLPGYYEFYPDLPPVLDFEGGGGSMLVLGDEFLSIEDGFIDTWMPTPWIIVNEEGEDQVNAALREFYDACVLDPSIEGCPFGFPEDPERDVALAPGEHWQVAAYPEVRAERLWYEHGAGFGLESSLPGEVRAQVQITEDGETRSALVSCPFWVYGLYAAFDGDAAFSIEPGTDMYQDECRSIVEVED
jgi:hypothetical protein